MDINKKKLTCERARDMMFSYIEGELGASDTARLMSHIESCEACRKELEERHDILKALGECEFTPPTSLKCGVMDKISSVPQEKVRPQRRFIPIGAVSGIAAAIMIFAVCRVFVFGGAVNDKALSGVSYAADLAEVFTVGNMSPAEAEEICDGAAPAEVCDDDAIYFMADMADAPAAEAPEAAHEKVEVYAVTSAIVAASPGYGLIADENPAPKENGSVKLQPTAAPEEAYGKIMASSGTASPVNRLFAKLRSDEHALIVCGSVDIELSAKADSEEILMVDGTELLHLSFTADVVMVYDEVTALLDAAEVYYCAASPEDGYGKLELFIEIGAEK